MFSKNAIVTVSLAAGLVFAAQGDLAASGPETSLGPAVACLDLVPELSGDSSAVSTSGTFSSQYRPWQAFDVSSSSMWISQVFETPAWISYDFGSNRLVTRYSIKNTNGSSLTSRAPKDFELQGWNGSEWVTIDTRFGETGWISGTPRVYDVASPGLYESYRLYILDDNDIRDGVVVISIGDLRFESCLFVNAGGF